MRGHKLTVRDQELREQILEFMTTGEVGLRDAEQEADIREFLQSLIDDGLIVIADRRMRLTERGKPFLRNACMALDERLRAQQPGARVFSQSL
jgi:oxygen-independent coproporphyrinogen-3 oxidase